MNSQKIQENFLNFFEQKGHHIQDPAPLLRREDTLFTIAGMQQFSDYFLALRKAPHSCYVTAQPCLRIGNKKYNDLNVIGKTKRHNSYFTMLGNFAFGAYGKREAIAYAWEFLTKFVDRNYLYVTIHSSDKDSQVLWTEHIDSRRIIEVSNDDNFWRLGDKSLCGPCTEIFFDTKKRLQLSPEKLKELINTGEELLELWNIVFMQYTFDGIEMQALDLMCIDTGMGLERLVSVIDGHYDNFQTDLLLPLVEKFPATLTESQRCILADHSRAIDNLLQEGLTPGSKEAEYVLRKLIRRCALIYDKYHEIMNHKSIISEVKLFRECIENLRKYLHKNITEEELVILYHSHGLPLEMLYHWAEKQELDRKKINQLIEKHKMTSKTLLLSKHYKTELLCYSKQSSNIARIIALFTDKGEEVESLQGKGYMICDSSVFYGRAGGQPGDRGIGTIGDHSFQIVDCLRQEKKEQIMIIHVVNSKEKMTIADTVKLTIDTKVREGHRRAHSGTHLLVDHLVRQRNKKIGGSAIKEDKFTLDIIGQPLGNEAKEIFTTINKYIEEDIQQSFKEGLVKHHKDSLGANEKNPLKRVRVIKFGTISNQLCCGTHVDSTGDIKKIVLHKEQKIGKNTIRLTVFVGDKALEAKREEKTLKKKETIVLFINKEKQIIVLSQTSNKIMIKKINKMNRDRFALVMSVGKGKVKMIVRKGQAISNIFEKYKVNKQINNNLWFCGFKTNNYKNFIEDVLSWKKSNKSI